MNSDKFKRQIESMWKHRDTDEQKRLVKFTIAKTMRLALAYPELAQEYFDSLCKVTPDNERITVSNYQHNLTSDGKEEDEMLYVSRKQIDALQGEIFKAIMDAHDADDWQDAAHYILDVMPRSFAALFGTNCLPDEAKNSAKEPKPSETKK